MDETFISEITDFILWMFGAFIAIVSGLISLFYVLGKAYLNSIITVLSKRTEKNEELIIENQKSIIDLSSKHQRALDQNDHHIKIVQKELEVFEKLYKLK